MITYLTAADTAKLVRKALRGAWPGVKFSVRRGTGSASAWLGITWTDGPREADVRDLVDRFKSADFNGMTDGYDARTPQAPENIHYGVDGINVSRLVSDETTRTTAQLLADQNPELFPAATDFSDMSGTEIRSKLMLLPVLPGIDVQFGDISIRHDFGDMGITLNIALASTDLAAA